MSPHPPRHREDSGLGSRTPAVRGTSVVLLLILFRPLAHRLKCTVPSTTPSHPHPVLSSVVSLPDSQRPTLLVEDSRLAG